MENKECSLLHEQGVVLMGFGTGCHTAVALTKNLATDDQPPFLPLADVLKGVIFHGPVRVPALITDIF